jgi:hypothetical protein
MTCTILRIEQVPGDTPRGVEQLNGDLLLPAAARPVVEKALLLAEDGLGAERQLELFAIEDAKRLMNIERIDQRKDPATANLLTVRPI